MMIKKLTVPLIALLFGCAIGPSYRPPQFDDTSDVAIVNVFREAQLLGAAMEPFIYVNGCLVGKLANSAYIATQVPAGPVRIGSFTSFQNAILPSSILAEMTKREIVRLEFEAEPRKEYFVRWNVDHEVLLLSEEEGSELIQDNRLRRPKPCEPPDTSRPET